MDEVTPRMRDLARWALFAFLATFVTSPVVRFLIIARRLPDLCLRLLVGSFRSVLQPGPTSLCTPDLPKPETQPCNPEAR